MASKTKAPGITGYFLIKVLLILILLLVVWKVPSFTQGGWKLRLVKGASSFLIPGVIVSVSRFVIISIYNARHSGGTVRGNFVLGINRLTAVINVTLFIIALMFVFGINPVEFLTGMTIVAMAIAVTFRDYITNMLSGLFIMFSDQLSVGDFIEVDGNRGKIEDITFSSIIMKNEDRDVVSVPNNMVFTHPLINLSAHKPETYIVKFELPIEMSSHTGGLEKYLSNNFATSAELKGCSTGNLMVDAIGKDFVTYKIELNTKTTDIYLHKKLEHFILRKVAEFRPPAACDV